MSLAAWSQSQTVDFSEIDTTSNRELMIASLPIVAESPSVKHIQIHRQGQIVDFFQSNHGKYGGTVLNYICETESNVYYYAMSSLPESMCESYLICIDNSGVPKFLKDSVQPDWDNVYFDCFGATIHSMWNHLYREQNYYCPQHQSDSLHYADTITALLSSLDSNDYLTQSSKALFDSLPGGYTYTRNGFINIYKFTELELKGWEKDKPRRDYIDSLSQFIDPYLKEKIKKCDAPKPHYCNYSSYYVKFKKNGKFNKMSVARESKYKIYEDGLFWFEERRELRKCRSYVKKSVKNVNLSSFNLKYEMVKRLTFVNDELVLY